MSKLRVHELAKEIGKTNKDVMDFLKSKNIDVKSHMSTVEDADVDMVRTNFRKGNMTAASTNTEEKPKKKLIGVYRPQNASRQPERKNRPQQANGTQQQSSRQSGNERQAQGGMKTENTGNTQNRAEQSSQSRYQGQSNRNNGEKRPNRFNNDNRQGQARNNGENRQKTPSETI